MEEGVRRVSIKREIWVWGFLVGYMGMMIWFIYLLFEVEKLLLWTLVAVILIMLCVLVRIILWNWTQKIIVDNNRLILMTCGYSVEVNMNNINMIKRVDFCYGFLRSKYGMLTTFKDNYLIYVGNCIIAFSIERGTMEEIFRV
jgi:hypothetical protein